MVQSSRAKARRLYSIFYDLETTTKFNVGQILNYCFTVVDPELTPVRELSGRIRISRLELPAPGAILANRTDVLEHQATTPDTEAIAMARITEFIWGAVREFENVNFIGFNSSRFDLQYLRTSLARHGINPYFGGRLIYRDLYHVAKKLAVTTSSFPRLPAMNTGPDEEGRLSLRLETLARAAGLLTGAQRHEAKADVEVTLALARHFRDTYELDVSTYGAYEALPHHRQPRSGDIVTMADPNYDLGAGPAAAVLTPMMLLEGTDKSVLWVDLERYRAGEGRRAIRWMNPTTGRFTCGPAVEWNEFREAAIAALEEFRSVTLDGYFSETECDIEEYIYRLKPAMIDALGRALDRNDPAEIRECKDAHVLFKRHFIAFGDEGERETTRRESMLRSYATYRYGGQMLMERSRAPEFLESQFHPTLQSMCRELDELLQG
ncbi:MAG: hypothetical protein RL417_584, partial [Pseudomonadota bacterium]